MLEKEGGVRDPATHLTGRAVLDAARRHGHAKHSNCFRERRQDRRRTYAVGGRTRSGAPRALESRDPTGRDQVSDLSFCDALRDFDGASASSLTAEKKPTGSTTTCTIARLHRRSCAALSCAFIRRPSPRGRQHPEATRQSKS